MSIRLLEHMRDELIATGIVQNTPEFCRSWLGRSEGYRATPRIWAEPCKLPQKMLADVDCSKGWQA